MPSPRPSERPIYVLLEDELTRKVEELRRQAAAGAKDPQMLVKSLDRIFGILAREFQHGEVVPKSRIPATLVARFDLSNLYVEDLPGFRRMLYTVEGDESAVTVIILMVIDHDEYDRLFRIRRR